MASTEPVKRCFFSRRVILGTTVGAALVFFLAGVIFWGGFNTAMESTNTLEFCIGCHEMEENVYEDYKPTIHYSNRTGVRATCPDCHVPDPWIHKMVRKIQASNEIYHKILGTVDTPEKFDEHRLTMAKRVWQAMKNRRAPPTVAPSTIRREKKLGLLGISAILHLRRKRASTRHET